MEFKDLDKKITIKNEYEEENFYIFYGSKILDSIKEIAKENKTQKIGYIYASKIAGVNEYIIEKITFPHPKDYSTPVRCRISKEHLQREINNDTWLEGYYGYPIGFWYTRVDFNKVQPCIKDIEEYEKTSKKHKINLFFIANKEKVWYSFYSYGNKLSEGYLNE